MMQGEKVAADIRDAHESLAGDAALLPLLSAISRRLQRRLPQAPDLIEPSVKALDEAMEALGSRDPTRSRRRCAACDFDPRELERCEERLFALRGMARKYSTRVDEPAGARGEIRRRTRGSQRGPRARRRARARRSRAASTAYVAAAEALSQARARAARALEEAVNAELPPLKLERARFFAPIADGSRRRLRRRLGPDRIRGADQSRLARRVR